MHSHCEKSPGLDGIIPKSLKKKNYNVESFTPPSLSLGNVAAQFDMYLIYGIEKRKGG